MLDLEQQNAPNCSIHIPECPGARDLINSLVKEGWNAKRINQIVTSLTPQGARAVETLMAGETLDEAGKLALASSLAPMAQAIGYGRNPDKDFQFAEIPPMEIIQEAQRDSQTFHTLSNEERSAIQAELASGTIGKATLKFIVGGYSSNK